MGHLFISLLAYHLVHTIRYQLKQHGINNSWESLRNILSMQIRSTTTLNLAEGGTLKVRKTSQATPEQEEIYKSLGISSQPCATIKSHLIS